MKRALKERRAVAAVLITLLALGAAADAMAADADQELSILKQTGRAFASIARESMPAVVFIKVEKTIEAGGRQRQFYYNNPFDMFGDDFMRRFFGYGAPQQQRAPRRMFKQTAQGSGFLISKDGYILTNNHIVGDVDKISVTLHDGREFIATPVGTDARSEVAVIRIEGEDFPFLELGDPDTLEIGHWVLAVGNPFGLAETVTAGIVSAKGRSNLHIADYENFIQTDAAINPGNSGGPLLDIEGKVVGINTAIYSQSGGYMGIGFAIPINMAAKIKDQLVRTGKVTRGFLGVTIQEMTPALADSFDMVVADGILVSDVGEDSAAEKAGIEQGDIILKLDGRDVGEVAEFRNRVAANPPGTELTLTVVRDGKEMEISVVTGELSEDGDMAEAVPEVIEQLGMTYQELTADIARQVGLEGLAGIVVTAVEPDSAAAEAGIGPGNLIVSVNRTQVSTVEEFEQAIMDADKSRAILMRVTNGRFWRYATLRLE